MDILPRPAGGVIKMTTKMMVVGIRKVLTLLLMALTQTGTPTPVQPTILLEN
jgi:hypothetical protein